MANENGTPEPTSSNAMIRRDASANHLMCVYSPSPSQEILPMDCIDPDVIENWLNSAILASPPAVPGTPHATRTNPPEEPTMAEYQFLFAQMRLELARAKFRNAQLEKFLQDQLQEIKSLKEQLEAAISNKEKRDAAGEELAEFIDRLEKEELTCKLNENESLKRKHPEEQNMHEDLKRFKMQPHDGSDGGVNSRLFRFQDQRNYEFIAWELQINAILETHRANWATEKEARAYLLKNLSARAIELLSPILARSPKMPINNILLKLRTYYVDPGLEARARIEYDALKQGNEPIWDFVRKFQKLADRAHVPEEQRVKDLAEKVASRFANCAKGNRGCAFPLFISKLRTFELLHLPNPAVPCKAVVKLPPTVTPSGNGNGNMPPPAAPKGPAAANKK